MTRDYAREKYMARSKSKGTGGRKQRSAALWLFIGLMLGWVSAGFLVITKPMNAISLNAAIDQMKAQEALSGGQKLIAATENINATSSATASTTPPAPKPQFDFYSVLPNDATVPATTIAPPAATVPEVKTVEASQEKLSSLGGAANTSAPPHTAKNTIIEEDEMVAVESETITPASAAEVVEDASMQKSRVVNKSNNALSSETKSRYVVHIGTYRDHAAADQMRAQLLLLGFEVKVQALKEDDTTWFRIRLGPFESRTQAEKLNQRLKANHISSQLMVVG